MARTRRSIPHWVKKSERRESFEESLGIPQPVNWPRSKSTALTLRQQVRTGNFDMSDKEAREEEAWRRKKQEEAYKTSLKE